MSIHHATIEWRNAGNDLNYRTYDRTHLWKFKGGTMIKASAAVEFLGKQEFVNPEEAFVASLSSCHMLTFLALASRKHLLVASYTDHAVGYLEKNENGKLYIKKVVLDPIVVFSGSRVPAHDLITALHHEAHQECFIANSVLTEIDIKAGEEL